MWGYSRCARYWLPAKSCRLSGCLYNQQNQQNHKTTKQPNNKTKPYPHHVENIVEKYKENMWTASGEQRDKEWRTKGKLRLYPHRLSTHFPSCGEIHTYHFPFHTYPHHLSIVYILQFLLNISTIYRLFHFSHIIYYYSYLFSFFI